MKIRLTLKPVIVIVITIASLVFLSLLIYSIPSLHNVAGKVFSSGSGNVPAGTPVTVYSITTNDLCRTSTFGPNGNNYACLVNGEDGETVIVRAWNATYYGENTSALANSPSTTTLNIAINTSRSSEANITILYPLNNSNYSIGAVFNITLNISMLGNDSVDCNATIRFTNNSVINISTNENLSRSIGNIAIYNTTLTIFNFTALSAGSTNLTINVSCLSDRVILERLNFKNIFNLTVQGALSNILVNLESPSNPTRTTDVNITFKYNVSSVNAVSHCNLTLNSAVNQTNTTIITDISQNFTVFNLNPGDYLWNVTCIENTGLSATSFTYNITVLGLADLFISASRIIFSNSTAYENQNITITANVSNQGNLDAYDVKVSFFKGNYTLGNYIEGNRTINVPAGSHNYTNVTFLAPIGTTNVFVVVDPPLDTNGTINESNENNNFAFNNLTVPISNIIVGNITGRLTLQDSVGSTLIDWIVTNFSRSNIYVADSESSINFNSLKALGRNLSGKFSSDDFAELDILLSSTNHSDSINRTFISGGNSKEIANFTAFGYRIENVSVTNSTNSSSFLTGIMWDSSDDASGNSQYDTTDKEDIVFITKVNQHIYGRYGLYDYEIMIPAQLRRYSLTDIYSVSIYAEIR